MDLTTLGTYIKNAIMSRLSTKQDTLESGVNIKTINGESLIGEGNIAIEAGGESVSNRDIDGGSANSVYLPTQTINGGDANG